MTNPAKAPPKVPIKKGGAVSQSHSRLPLILIGAGKLFKAGGLVFAAFIAGYLLKPDQHRALIDLLDSWRLDPKNHHLYWLLEKVVAIDETHLRLLRVGTIIYAILFLIEGAGLILDFAWAEWLLVLTTGLLLPVEVWELIERRAPLPAIIFILNVAIMVYVCYRLKWRLQDHRTKKREAAAATSSGATTQGSETSQATAVSSALNAPILDAEKATT